MSSIFKYIALLALIVLVSSTTVSIMTVKPAQPKNVVAFTEYYEYKAVEKIKNYSKQGYIVKSCASASPHWIVIMEKY